MPPAGTGGHHPHESPLTMLVPIGLLAVGLSVWHNPNRLGRVMAYMHPEEHREGKGYQQYQATLALGAGGTTGVGGRGTGTGTGGTAAAFDEPVDETAAAPDEEPAN